MGIRLSLWPLSLIITRKPGGSKWGRTRGPVIIVPHDSPLHQMAHEKHHVWQWWVITLVSAGVIAAVASTAPVVSYWACALSVGVMGAAMFVSKEVRFRLEASAYAVSARIAPSEMDRFARALESSYGTGKTFYEARGAIQERM